MSSRFGRWYRSLGPGLVTGASDDDPSGIATYTQAGASFGYATLWLALFTLPLMIAVQEMSARIAIVTQKGLVQNWRDRSGAGFVSFASLLLAFANAVNIGADLGMMASASQLLVPLPFAVLLLLMAAVTLGLQIFTSYAMYAKYLKWLTVSLLSYVLVAFVVHVDWAAALGATFIPRLQFNTDYLLLLVALLGTTISPYLYFWQAAQEVEEILLKKRDGKKRRAPIATEQTLHNMRSDVSTGMVFSNVVSWFVILTAAAVLFASGHRDITSAVEAARVLEPLSGHFASVLFTLGIIGTGLLTIPVLSSTNSYAVCEIIGCQEGLDRKWYQARTFYGVIILSTIIGLGFNFLGINPIQALIYAAVANGLVAPFLLFAILRIANDRKIMGAYANGRWSNLFGWLTFAVMTAAPLLWLAWSL